MFRSQRTLLVLGLVGLAGVILSWQKIDPPAPLVKTAQLDTAVSSPITTEAPRQIKKSEAVLVPKKSSELVLVSRIIDGDTIQLETGEKVRYIGINTPESVDPRRPVQCFGKEAAEYNRQLVENKFVRLEKDISDTDRYGRLLRYVYLEDGTFVNFKLVEQGYAQAATFPPDVQYSQLFYEATKEARVNKRGLWSVCK